jgi:hypothetical protein
MPVPARLNSSALAGMWWGQVRPVVGWRAPRAPFSWVVQNCSAGNRYIFPACAVPPLTSECLPASESALVAERFPCTFVAIRCDGS